jgi:hypothetical protein
LFVNVEQGACYNTGLPLHQHFGVPLSKQAEGRISLLLRESLRDVNMTLVEATNLLYLSKRTSGTENILIILKVS